MDKHNRFETEPFSYKETKDGKLLIYRNNKQIKLLKGKAASDFLRLAKTAEQTEIQLKLAKLTGNYKRGNEKIEEQF